MKLLEYEAKAILSQHGIPVPGSQLLSSSSQSLSKLSPPVVLKSQVPVGGRGKAGGIILVDNPEDIAPTFEKILTKTIKGFTPKTILAERALSIAHEFYLALLINRASSCIQLMAHSKGGIEVESNNTNDFLVVDITPTSSSIHIGEQLAEYFNLPDQTFILQDMVQNLLDCFMKNDVTLLEINPLILTKEGLLVAGDCKMELDDAAQFRHPEWKFEQASTEANFVTLDSHGTIATIANGAGLAMATVDAVANHGMKPANFLDIGGGANAESVLAAFERIMEYPNIKAIVINIFAGITRCDEVAKAIIEARAHIDDLPPLCIRLAGTNYTQAAALLADEGIEIMATLEDCLAAAKEHSA